MAKVHHLNCGTMCPAARRWVNGEGGLFESGLMVCHVLLVETARSGLVLVDSGFGTHDVANPRLLGALIRASARPRFAADEPALVQVQRLGFRPEDVRHLVVTHLDVDHAGGLSDFPWAKVHLHEREHRAAIVERSFTDRARYIARHFAHRPDWVLYTEEGEDWFGFKKLRPLAGLDEVALVPLFGHSKGHSGVLVETEGRSWLHSGDAFFNRGELEAQPHCPSALAAFQAITNVDRRARLENTARLRALHQEHGDRVGVVCAHDPVQLSLAQTAAS